MCIRDRNKLYDLAAMQEEVPATVKAHYGQLSANAKDCIQCGGCETRCPFGVRIAVSYTHLDVYKRQPSTTSTRL